ncbi:MAG: SDR family oxidoreductase [Pseudomonas sp.]
MSQPIALITGCSSGIGRALAEQCQAAGYRVWATARKAEDLEALQAAGFDALQLDVNDAAAIERLAERLTENGGGLDLLINNAGYGAMGPLLDGGAEALRQQFETNVFSMVAVTRALFALLRQSKGLVVNIGSVSGVLVTPFAGAYCASKAAVHALSDALRMELAPFGIRVMEVQPGAIATHFAANASREAELLIAEDSPWWPLREGIRARANASQEQPTPALHLARCLLAAVQQSNPPRLLRVGNGSRVLPLLGALVPKALMDKLLKKRFGLDRSL